MNITPTSNTNFSQEKTLDDSNLLNITFVNLVGKNYDKENPLHQGVYQVLTYALSGDVNSLNKILVDVSKGDQENQKALLSQAYQLALDKGNHMVCERLKAYKNSTAIYNEMREQNLIDKVYQKPEPQNLNMHGWV